jgi:tetratricopeptide (TPR) repeat protein
MIECGKCKSENHFDGAIFCKNCGAELAATRVAVKVIDTGDENRESESKVTAAQSDRGIGEVESEFQVEDVSNDSDRVPAVSLEIESNSENAHGFDQLLKRYEKENASVDALEERGDTAGLGLESPTDFLLRQQTNVPDQFASIPVPLPLSPKHENLATTRNSLAQSPETQRVKSPLDGASFRMEDGTMSADEKGKLIDSLHKTFAEPEKGHDPLPDRKSDVPNESVAKQKAQAPMREPRPAPLESAGELPDIRANISSTTQVAVFVRGHKLIFPSKVRPMPGESVTYNNHKYPIQKASIDKKSWLLGGVFVGILLAIVMVQSFSSAPTAKPILFGVVTNSETKEVLAGVSVSIPQTGASTLTDENGTFRFVGLQDGRYEVKIEGGLYEARLFSFAIKDRQSEMVNGSLNPLIAKPTTSVQGMSNQAGESVVSTGPLYGELKIRSNVADATVILDGRALGMASQAYKKIAPGTHTLEVQRSGYETYSQTVKVVEGETTELAVDLAQAKANSPAEYTASDFFQQGEALMTEKNYSEAIGYYTLALAKDNSIVKAYLRRAEASIALGKPLNARADYRSAADVYLHSSQFADAVECYDKIIELSPNAADAYQLRGWAKISAGNYDGGVKDLEKALSFNKEDTQSQFELGKALYITGNYKESQKTLKKIRKFGDESPEIYGFLALTSLAQGDESEARKVYDAFRKRANSAQVARMSTESGWQRLTALAGK